jgi:hypothetical protein
VSKPDIELESFLIVVTAPVWFGAFAGLYLAGAVADWWRARG